MPRINWLSVCLLVAPLVFGGMAATVGAENLGISSSVLIEGVQATGRWSPNFLMAEALSRIILGLLRLVLPHSLLVCFSLHLFLLDVWGLFACGSRFPNSTLDEEVSFETKFKRRTYKKLGNVGVFQVGILFLDLLSAVLTELQKRTLAEMKRQIPHKTENLTLHLTMGRRGANGSFLARFLGTMIGPL